MTEEGGGELAHRQRDAKGAGSMTRGAGVLGIAAALPEEIRTNGWWDGRDERTAGDVFERPTSEMLRARGMDAEVARRFAEEASDPFLGARERRVLAADRQPSDLELEAAEAALERAGVEPESIDVLIVFSHLGDVAAPSNAPLLAHRLGLRGDVLAFGAEREGASLPLHLELAAKLLAGRYEHALLVQSCVSSRLIDASHITSRVLGDAAVAMVVGPVPEGCGFLGASHRTLGEFHRMAQLRPGGSTDAPWYRGDVHRAALTWQSPEPALSRQMGGQLASVFESVVMPLLRRGGFSPSDVDHLVSYEPRGWAPEVFCERLGIPAERTISRFTSVGYTLAASAGLGLEAFVRAERIREGDLVLIYSKGSGASSSACLLRWH